MNSPQRSPRTQSDDFILVERLERGDGEEVACSYVEMGCCGLDVYALVTISSLKFQIKRQPFCDGHVALLFAQWNCGPDHLKPFNSKASAPPAVKAGAQ